MLAARATGDLQEMDVKDAVDEPFKIETVFDKSSGGYDDGEKSSNITTHSLEEDSQVQYWTTEQVWSA